MSDHLSISRGLGSTGSGVVANSAAFIQLISLWRWRGYDSAADPSAPLVVGAELSFAIAAYMCTGVDIESKPHRPSTFQQGANIQLQHTSEPNRRQGRVKNELPPAPRLVDWRFIGPLKTSATVDMVPNYGIRAVFWRPLAHATWQ
jgi:hypothetical protein